ncbi:hypothetical protein ACSDR0_24705 [Streptosporangium sp. G11]|uniref:hypothetical protein n=1 Tax=Streptosporangium sp. G11 TaxID=3436926 RepID=UPI003EB905C8
MEFPFWGDMNALRIFFSLIDSTSSAVQQTAVREGNRFVGHPASPGTYIAPGGRAA